MKLKMKLIRMAVLATALLTVQAGAGDELVLKTPKDKENYATGVNIVRKLKQQRGEVNLDIVIKGMKDELTDDKLLMTEEDLRKTTAALQTEQTQKQKQASTAQAYIKAEDTGAAKKTASAGPADNSAVRIVEGQAQKTGQVGQGGQTAQNKVGTSVVERAKARSEIKARAAEMRRRTIEQERQGAI